MVLRAKELGLYALAITDRHTLAGAVRMHQAAKEHGLKLLIGAQVLPLDGPPLRLYAMNRAGYARLAKLLTIGNLRASKGECELYTSDVAAYAQDLIGMIDVHRHEGAKARGIFEPSHDCKGVSEPSHDRKGVLPRKAPRDRGAKGPRETSQSAIRNLQSAISNLRSAFGDRLYLAAAMHAGAQDRRRVEWLYELSHAAAVPVVAVNDVYYHEPPRRFLQDVLVCIREHCTLPQAGSRLFPNAERCLKSPAAMARLFHEHPDALARTLELADRCTFSLDELRYEYPEELCPPGTTPLSYLTELTRAGAGERYPAGVPQRVQTLIDHELKLIEELSYEPYFLTVWDLVRFARARGILCQGRGSAANSAVCYCLGVTSVDPDRIDLLFERFVSRERNEPPDIDIDFEHERREEVFQYIYEKYGRHRAGIVAEVITYRPRSAVRDVGKALGLSLDRVDALAKKLEWWGYEPIPDEGIREAGLDPQDYTVRCMKKLVEQIMGFPRHLSQHVGGFVMTRGPLNEIVPIGHAAMPNRTFIEWDKDDIDALGILKVDCLALGMLTALGKGFKLLGAMKPRSGKGSGIGDRGSGVRECSESPSSAGKNGEEYGDVVSRIECVAEGGGVSEGCLQAYGGNAEGGKIWVDDSDSKSGRVGSQQHRRRQCPQNAQGLRIFPDGRSRIAGGVGNPIAHRAGTRDDSGTQACMGIDRRSDSDAASADQSTERITTRSPIPNPPFPIPHPPFPIPDPRSPIPSPHSLTDIPPEDPAVYDMICQADTVGVFQIESRAQMSMLPRLKPRNFYDLVIEVAIVRPGPIQGGMVHPFLRRREGREPVVYPNDAIKDVLHKTLGVPLFQEQAMRLAVVAAGFTPGEADQLRRAMGAWRRSGGIEAFRIKLMEGMRANGLPEEFALRVFDQIRGFGEYGFPESHAASFALLVYASAWLKRYHPAAFTAALLNSHPMGFYAPAQLVRDAREHGVEVRGVDVNVSEYDCTLEERHEGTKARRKKRRSDEATERRSDEGEGTGIGDRGSGAAQSKISNLRSDICNPDSEFRIPHSAFSSNPQSAIRNPQFSNIPHSPDGPALRLGFRMIKGMSEAKVAGIVRGRAGGPYRSVADLARRCGASRAVLARLAAAGAFESLGLNRRQAVWQVLALGESLPLFDGLEPVEDDTALPPLSIEDEVFSDYDHAGLSLKAHPVGLLRPALDVLKVSACAALKTAGPGRWIRVAGLVLVRQRPGTAKGITFMTLEDETGVANLVVRPNVYERCRRAAREATALIAGGRVERQGDVIHVSVTRLEDVSDAIATLKTAPARDIVGQSMNQPLKHRSRDFR